MLPRHVYVHVPFCGRRCSYCDFAIAVRPRVPTAEYVDCLRAELDLRFPEPQAEPVDTVYLGGGTPSRLDAAGLETVLQAVAARFPPAPNAEVTVEANPEDVSSRAVDAWRAAGVNRVSLGAQSFETPVLEWMHRTHTAEAIGLAARALRDGGIENWSLDLIFALPPSLPRSWEADLERALALQPPHVSLYGLTIESATPLGRWRDRGNIVEAGEERYEREYLTAHRTLTAAGYEHYEVSNFARPAAASRHNRGYWTGASYVGLGPAAHGFDGTARRWNDPAYASWSRRVRAGLDPVAGSETLTEENRLAERVYLGLRTSAGLEIAGREAALVALWRDAGWAMIDGSVLRLSAEGWLRLDSLAASLTDVRSR